MALSKIDISDKKLEKVKLRELARVIRSKNAGPFTLTLDILFPTMDAFSKAKASGAINVDTISKLYDVEPKGIEIIFYPPGLAIKIVMARPVGSGDLEDTDVYGAQQHTPLLDLMIPVEKST
jgi:hypothetical protein